MEHGDPNFGALLWSLVWLLAILALFTTALRLPLQVRLPAWGARVYSATALLAALGVAVFANVALTLHDVHIDLTREKAYTPSAAVLRAIDALSSEVTLTYF